MRIPLVQSSFYHEAQTQAALATFVGSAKKLSMGEECAKFERAFALFQKRKHAVFVSNGSMGNLVLLQAMLNLGILNIGDRIGVSALTWATNVMPILQLGMMPVALDCEIESLNVSSAILRNHLDALDGLFITNALGFCDDLSVIKTLCAEKNVVLIEDNCESLGSMHEQTLLGNFGLASTFSFFVGHHFSTIEGGMMCTDDDALHEMFVRTRAHGWDRNLPPDRQKILRKEHDVDDFFALYTFYDLAYNARPTEINGFLGNAQITFLPEIIQKRVQNFEAFKQALHAKNDWYYRLETNHMDYVSNFAMPVICKSTEIFAKAVQAFRNAEVEIRPVIAGDITKHPFYRKYVLEIAECPHASLMHRQGFYFPNNPELSEAQIAVLISLLTTHAA